MGTAVTAAVVAVLITAGTTLAGGADCAGPRESGLLALPSQASTARCVDAPIVATDPLAGAAEATTRERPARPSEDRGIIPGVLRALPAPTVKH